MRRLRKILLWTGWTLLTLLVITALAALTVWFGLRGSLAQLDGTCAIPGLRAKVRIDRDALGVPTIYAVSRVDATRALGFLHAQERFFQMDLSRRAGGGELSALVGPAALEMDKQQRVHQPRMRAQQAFEHASNADQELIRAYTEGVNAGLKALQVRPPEYLALRVAPQEWTVQDMFLVSFAMFNDLHDTSGWADYREFALENAFSRQGADFFDAPDTSWSAAIDGSELTMPPMPAAETMNIRNAQASLDGGDLKLCETPNPDIAEKLPNGSNNWAISGRRTKSGCTIVANDMHLGLGVPTTWYRARIVYGDPMAPGAADVIGVTLPGTPVVVSGSNGQVAWGNTASYLDICDLVRLERDPADPSLYRTPAGEKRIEPFQEIIVVRGSTNFIYQGRSTIWGPIVSWGGLDYALSCTMHFPEAVNLGLIELERAGSTAEALEIANRCGTPVNNLVVGDRLGSIGYSILGRLPRRVGFDGRTPASWARSDSGWQGWLSPSEYPRWIDPTNGFLWTANSRVLGTPEYNRLHITGPDNGARARQIRDGLAGLDKTDEHQLWNIYNDDRALFLTRWQELMLKTLTTSMSTNSSSSAVRGLVENWGGRASVNSQGYRLVESFRSQALALLFEPFNRRQKAGVESLGIKSEDAAWEMLRSEPVHLLNARFTSYSELLSQAVENVLIGLRAAHTDPANATWGHRNRAGIRHPLSRAIPALARWLDMPNEPVSGDHHMPKVHRPGFGVSERMVVTPGRESEGLFNLPGGQSGHFLSPFYRAELDSWMKVAPQPLLPGPSVHKLVLRGR